MKEWTLTVRILLAAASYVLSLIMFVNTSAFGFGDFKTSLITVNIIAFIVIGIVFAVTKNMLAPNFFVCMGFCIPSLMAYSKLGERIFEVNVVTELNALTTSVLFLTVIVMLMTAEKLKKMEKEYLSLVSSGADEETVKLITSNSMKVYLTFLVGVFCVTFIVFVVGIVFLNLRGSTSIAIITAILGIALFLGCVYYLSKKLSK